MTVKLYTALTSLSGPSHSKHCSAQRVSSAVLTEFCIPKCYNTDCLWIVSLIFKPVSTVATSLYGFVMLSEKLFVSVSMFVDAYENSLNFIHKINKILFWFSFIEFTYKEKVGGQDESWET